MVAIRFNSTGNMYAQASNGVVHFSSEAEAERAIQMSGELQIGRGRIIFQRNLPKEERLSRDERRNTRGSGRAGPLLLSDGTRGDRRIDNGKGYRR